jgi:nucleotide-binding universal stress UspA family protein
MRPNEMKLLICSEGSEQADRAIKLGAALAAGCQAEVTLLGIVEAPGENKTILDALKRAQSLLEDKKIHAELITKAGNPIEEIIKRTAETQYDLVIIGAVRKETQGAFWLSSKSYKIIKEIKPPVLLAVGQSTTIKRLLICSGGKRYIDAAVRLGGTIARGVGAAVSILHVMPEPPALFAHLPKMEEDTALLLRSHTELGNNLRHAKETLESMNVQVEVRLRHGQVLEEILRELRLGEYDLVVTGSALSRSLRTYVLGDISREIVNRASCAVLIVRGQEIGPEQRFSLKHLLERFALKP